TPILANDPHKTHGRTIAVVPCEYCRFQGTMSGNAGADYETRTTKANVRLIAAAPDLLAALELCVLAQDEASSGFDGLTCESAERIETATEQARAILAKIRGQ